MSRTRDQQRFTISEVAADWHESMVLIIIIIIIAIIIIIIINGAAAHYVAIHCPC